jgi:formylglycine-generating enzyme required for sulfatase activity
MNSLGREEMKAINSSVALCIVLSALWTAATALADESSFFKSTGSNNALEAPRLTVKIEGIKVTLLWNEINGATEYVVHYAQYPYDNPDTIKTIDVGDKTSATYDLSPGCAYHVAVKACKDSGPDCGDYSTIHDVKIPIISSFKNSLGQEFKLIPAGKFTMGSPPDEPGRNDWFVVNMETQHVVTLTKPFYMQTTEVTQAQWKAVMGSNPSEHTGCPTCPVETVSWDDAQSYITKLNTLGEGTYSLPTEAQWEYAARAGSTTAFYNGAITQTDCEYNACTFKDGDGDPNLVAIGWYCDNSLPYPGDQACEVVPSPLPTKSRMVALKSPNAWGLYDMSGNVWEWCQDWFDSYSSSAVTDPAGPSSGLVRVIRGGCVINPPPSCRSANRWIEFPNSHKYGIGFRLVRMP